MKHGPWVSGPQELIDHAKDHLAKESDVDNRFAMISVDNAVELMLKTYLTLPERVTELRLTRKEQQEHTRSFLTALGAIEQLVGDRLKGVRLDEIEWFHRVRNQLYHEGNIITVERDKVTRYLEHAELLMDRLFPEPLASDRPTRPGRISPRMKRYQAFFEMLRTSILGVDPNFTRAIPTPQSSFGLGSGRGGFSIVPTFTANHKFRIDFKISLGNKERNEIAFEQLKERRAFIEQRIGQELVWDAVPGAQQCRVYAVVDATIEDDDERLAEVIEWATPLIIKFREVFGPLIKNLEVDG